MQIGTLQRLAKASSLAYLSIDKIPSSPYYQSSQLQPLFQVVDPHSESGATVFLPDGDANDSSIIVACRGSANLKNFGTNLKFNLVPATKLSMDVPEDALVHEGFQDASLGLWKELWPKLFDVLDSNDGNGVGSKEIVFTGHSLGAGKESSLSVEIVMVCSLDLIRLLFVNVFSHSIIMLNTLRYLFQKQICQTFHNILRWPKTMQFSISPIHTRHGTKKLQCVTFSTRQGSNIGKQSTVMGCIGL
jgi:hypothetical protein